ncbi:MAG TPA: SDR family oxidoreductase [Anaerolineae bacterium]|nr:SDR family oxidoreductase [Anaerolineae bacterium]
MERRTLENHVALITGASSGIGEATARLMAQHGCHLVLAARRLEHLETLAEELEGVKRSVTVLPLQVDVTKLDQVEMVVEATLERYRKIDILFNNAGVGRLGWLEELDPESQIDRQIQTNLLGSILMTRAVLPHMQARKVGHIIQMSSVAGLIGAPTYSVYAASKFGVRGFSEALRREVAAWGIHVTVIYPGAVKTSFAQEDVMKRRTGLRSPKAIVLEPEVVAKAVVDSVLRPKRSVVLPFMMRPIVWLNQLWPNLIDWAVKRFFVERERGEVLK